MDLGAPTDPTRAGEVQGENSLREQMFEALMAGRLRKVEH